MINENFIHKKEHEIRAEKCSDTCHHKMKFVLTFTKNDLTLVEINAITLSFGSDTCQIKVGIVQVSTKCSENVRCPTVISCAVKFFTLEFFCIMKFLVNHEIFLSRKFPCLR